MSDLFSYTLFVCIINNINNKVKGLIKPYYYFLVCRMLGDEFYESRIFTQTYQL